MTTLDDLRKMNMREQQREQQAVDAAPQEALPSALTEVRNPVNAEIRESVRTDASEEGHTQAPTEASTSASTPVRPRARKGASAQVSTPASAQVGTDVRTPVLTGANIVTRGATAGQSIGVDLRSRPEYPLDLSRHDDLNQRITLPPGSLTAPPFRLEDMDLGTPNQPPALSDAILERVLYAIGTKRTHQGGVKATVDMSPDLSMRAKRFCLDHGNVAVRQVFIELLAALLDAEGY